MCVLKQARKSGRYGRHKGQKHNAVMRTFDFLGFASREAGLRREVCLLGEHIVRKEIAQSRCERRAHFKNEAHLLTNSVITSALPYRIFTKRHVIRILSASNRRGGEATSDIQWYCDIAAENHHGV